mmetsp:Transcript_30395/g.90110  ORF Transcript_30395/g.90110 Transcript_30395/m.90110 type:complete len:256 (+) Transcript_30395:359-1126(+)
MLRQRARGCVSRGIRLRRQLLQEPAVPRQWPRGRKASGQGVGARTSTSIMRRRARPQPLLRRAPLGRQARRRAQLEPAPAVMLRRVRLRVGVRSGARLRRRRPLQGCLHAWAGRIRRDVAVRRPSHGPRGRHQIHAAPDPGGRAAAAGARNKAPRADQPRARQPRDGRIFGAVRQPLGPCHGGMPWRHAHRPRHTTVADAHAAPRAVHARGRGEVLLQAIHLGGPVPPQGVHLPQGCQARQPSARWARAAAPAPL